MREDLGRELAALLAADPPRAGSLVITLFGDVVSQQGGTVWLGSLVTLLAEFTLNERQVRTAIFRLARDGWLAAERYGRRRYYALSPFGQRLFARAAARIYAAEDTAWNGEWTLVLPGGNLLPEVRDELRKRLSWQGFGVLGAGLFAHPRADAGVLEEILVELGLADTVVVWQARARDEAPLRRLVQSAWQLDDVAARYSAFIARFEPFARALERGAPCRPRDALVLRCLLIHAYRRILLRTIELPAELLPPAWPGYAARALAARLYRLVHAKASAHASAALQDTGGSLPAPGGAFYARYGGLTAAGEQAA